MSAVYFHLALNHVPILGSVFCLLLLAYAALRRSDEVARVALVGLVLAALIAIPVYLTGEPAEEAVEGIRAVTHESIEKHEDAGKIALYGAIALGVAALASLVAYRRRSLPPQVVGGMLALTTLGAGWFLYTGNLGGKIRHPEAHGTVVQESHEAGEKHEREESH